MNEIRGFFKSLTNDPRVSRFDGGSQVGDTMLPVINTLKIKIDSDTPREYFATDPFSGADYYLYKLRHDTNRITDFFGRFSYSANSNVWHMLQQDGYADDKITPNVIWVHEIKQNELDLLFSNITLPINLEIYFIDFSF